ncbi:MAG TPA: FecR domain-containing protein [Edaphocola sp.]|nr:FecR domain-containing protein [Edaphocola sp.]
MATDKNMDDLLIRDLIGESNEAEQLAVKQWLAASWENQRHYEQLKQIWEESAGLRAGSPSEEDAWQRFQKRIHPETDNKNKAVKLRRNRRIAAAIVLVLLSSGLLWTVISKPAAQVVLTANRQVLTDTLPDNTIVTLNKNSRMRFPKKFGEKKRVVELEGEAFFNVSHEARHPFVVQVSNLTITDIGTAFNVHESKNATEVIVAEGSVEVKAKGRSVVLAAHEKVIVSKEDGLLKKERTSSRLFNYYLTREFACSNTPLSDLVSILNEAYDAKVVIASPELGRLPITATFHREQPLDSILTIIAQTFQQVSLSKQGEKFILSRK